MLLQGRQWAPFFHENPFSYDSWSIGVVVSADCILDSSIYCCVPTHAVCLQALELLLGSPNVFSVDQRTKALLTNRLRKEGASERDIQRGLYLAGKLSLVLCGWDSTHSPSQLVTSSALSQFCIYVPTESKSWPLRKGDPLHREQIVKNKCTLEVSSLLARKSSVWLSI